MEISRPSQSAQDHTQVSEDYTAATHTAKQFTLFKQLPFELQLQIWRASIPHPQILRIRVEADESLHDSTVFTRDDFDWEADQNLCLKSFKFSAPYSKAPGLLAACKDSRAVILTVYNGILKSKGETVIRFDPENDTIFLIPNGQDNSVCQCNESNDELLNNIQRSYPTRKTMCLGIGTAEIPSSSRQRSRDFRSIFGDVKKLIMVWSEFFCVHSADMTWTLSNFSSLKDLTLVTPIRKDAYCCSYLQAVGSPTIWCVEQISSHFSSAQWLVEGLRNDMTTLNRFKQKLGLRKSLYYRDEWELPRIIRFGGCYTEWVEGRE